MILTIKPVSAMYYWNEDKGDKKRAIVICFGTTKPKGDSSELKETSESELMKNILSRIIKSEDVDKYKSLEFQFKSVDDKNFPKILAFLKDFMGTGKFKPKSPIGIDASNFNNINENYKKEYETLMSNYYMETKR
jgi:hypothetical protein